MNIKIEIHRLNISDIKKMLKYTHIVIMLMLCWLI